MCHYHNFQCIPREDLQAIIVWRPADHEWSIFQKKGILPVKKIRKFHLIPLLGVGGLEIARTKNGVTLDTGYEIITKMKGPYRTTKHFQNISKKNLF